MMGFILLCCALALATGVDGCRRSAPLLQSEDSSRVVRGMHDGVVGVDSSIFFRLSIDEGVDPKSEGLKGDSLFQNC